jgi:sn-glycerol 3-phosphate transport system ATP-binding protein
VESVTKSFPGPVLALAETTFDVAAGETMVVRGPSGSGKTTLLRLIAGLELPTSGAIRLDGGDVTRLPPNERRIGFVFQQPTLWPHYSVAENMAFGAKVRAGLYGWRGWTSNFLPTADARRRRELRSRIEASVLNVARALGVKSLLQRRPQTLSGGEQQRAAIGRSLVSGCRLLLLDEPFSHLDFELRRSLLEELKCWREQFKLTMLYVSHDPDDAVVLSARTLLLQKEQAPR